MKISVTLSLDIDPVAWDLAYGTGTHPTNVRADVRSYILNAVQSLAPVKEGGIVAVRLDR